MYVLIPAFTKKSGIEVRVVAVGTGQALRNAANCDGDLVLVHSPEDEKAFMKKGLWGAAPGGDAEPLCAAWPGR